MWIRGYPFWSSGTSRVHNVYPVPVPGTGTRYRYPSRYTKVPKEESVNLYNRTKYLIIRNFLFSESRFRAKTPRRKKFHKFFVGKVETCLKHHFAYPNVTAGATRGSVRNHACAIVPTVLLRALIIKAQSCRRAHIISNENSFIHDVPRGGAVSLGRRRAAVRGGAEQRQDRAPPPTLCQVPTVCQVPAGGEGLRPSPPDPTSPARLQKMSGQHK